MIKRHGLRFPLSINAKVNINNYIDNENKHAICIPIDLSCPFSLISVVGLPPGVEYHIGTISYKLDDTPALQLVSNSSQVGYIEASDDKLVNWKKKYELNKKFPKVDEVYDNWASVFNFSFLVFDKNQICSRTHFIEFPIIITVFLCEVLELEMVNKTSQLIHNYSPTKNPLTPKS